MKSLARKFSLGFLAGLLAVGRLHGALIIGDSYNVTGNGSGFALDTGINSGINPPTTRLTGSAASGLRYLNTGTKVYTAFTITSNRLQVTAAADPGRFVLSANGTAPFNFASALGTGSATPANPKVYDLHITMNNNSDGVQRFSFAIGTAEGDATTWSFGVQVYRAASGDNFYTIGKRIDTTSSGLASDLNEAILTMTPYTYATDINILMRVTDAGSESGSAYHSRVQLSLNGGNSWFYDTATDSDLAGTGWRFNGAGRYIMWDIAPGAGPVSYENFSVNSNPPLSNVKTGAVFRAMSYNIHGGRGPDGEVYTQRIADFILANDVDLVSLNEVSRFMSRGDNRDIIAELAQETGMTYVFSNNNTALTGNDQFGNAILSKYPVLYRGHILLPNVGDNEQRGLLKTVVDVNGKMIDFWSTHLDFKDDDTERLMCVTNFNIWVGEELFPVIIAGDFNSTPNTPTHVQMETKWDDIWPLAGDGTLGRTSPCPMPLKTRIDYIWRAQAASAVLKPTNAFVGYSLEASDHYCVLTDFIIANYTNHAPGFGFAFNEGTGTKVTDTSGKLSGSFNATNAPTWNTSSPGGQAGDYSLLFSGGKRVTIIDTNQIIGTNGLNDDYTLQAWVKLPVDYAPADRAVMFQYERRPGFSFSINTNRTLHTTAFKIKDIPSSAAVPNDGQWHHVAVVHTDGANMKFYIDATLAATVAYTNGAGYRTSPVITIGSDERGMLPFSGNLDRVRFDQKALTPAQFDFPSGNTNFAAWAAIYSVSDPNADPDGDGQSNMAEYTAGTNPTNAASVFKILGATRLPDGRLSLTWSSVGGKRYRIQYSDGGIGGFTDVTRDASVETDAHSPGQAATQTFIETEAPTNSVRYYRVRIVP